MDLEISTELSVCKANPEALKFFNTVKKAGKAGKRVVIISDMYLSASTISTILISCGYDLTGVNVYVSSEYGKTKRSGNLFREVLKALKPLNPLRGVEVSASVLQRREELKKLKKLKKLESCESPETVKKLESDRSGEGVDSVEGKHVLHIGDNYISDVLMPRKCGMKSFLYNRCSRS